MQIQLIWTDLETGSPRQPVLETPIALGREFTLMPGVIDGQRVSRIVLQDDRVDPFHALIIERDGELLITDQGSQTGVKINGVALPSSTLVDGDRLQLGPFQIQVDFSIKPNVANSVGQRSGQCNRMVGFLFKRRCERTSTAGCPDCETGQVNETPYFYEQRWYSGYGTYSHGHWGHNYYRDRDCYAYNPTTRSVDFTEADSAAFMQEGENDYEQNVGAS
ncbi:MAG: hypothetical protein Kow00121_60340 [Elainellaceae cyanobacterium]